MFLQLAFCVAALVQDVSQVIANTFGSRLSLVVTVAFEKQHCIQLSFLHGGGAYGIDPPLKQS